MLLKTLAESAICGTQRGDTKEPVSITGKPLEVRQGKGKGNVEYWVAQIQPGKVLYEVQGVSEEMAREAFALASAKIPVATTFVRRSVM